MKYVVSIADKKFEVEIEDIFARPVIARVNGQEFKVSPENEVMPAASKEPKEFKPGEAPKPLASPGTSSSELTAPLPGTVLEVFFKAGEYVEMGQVVLVIEAMKMKNSIRSTRAGTISEVLVSAGQTVAHKQALVKFAEPFVYR